MSKPQHEWFKLDNAGIIFPGQNTSKWSNIFRFSVYLKEKIDPDILSAALKDVLPRFPCFDVHLGRGIFWYFLERQGEGVLPPVMKDVGNPCHRVRFKENNRFLFRVFYYEKRISVEFFHALTDAYGASLFLCTLTARYIELTGHPIPAGGMVANINEPAAPGELEDAFSKYASSKAKIKRSASFVYHARGKRLPAHRVNVTTGYLDCDALHKKAKEYGATITEYCAAVMLWVMYKKQQSEKSFPKSVSVQVPVNLRRHFPTATMRNFSLCYNVLLDPLMGEYTFPEVVKLVMLYLRSVNNEKTLNAMMTKNMHLETNPIMRIMPLFMKRLGLYTAYSISGEKTVSSLFSNLGIVNIPPEMEPFIDRFMLMTGPGVLNGARTAAVTFGNIMAITFADIYVESDIEREFFTHFVKDGIHVKIESNRE